MVYSDSNVVKYHQRLRILGEFFSCLQIHTLCPDLILKLPMLGSSVERPQLTTYRSDYQAIIWYSPVCSSGPSCMKLMMSLVNEMLIFQTYSTQICHHFFLKKKKMWGIVSVQKGFFYNFFLVKNTATIDFASTERQTNPRLMNS